MTLPAWTAVDEDNLRRRVARVHGELPPDAGTSRFERLAERRVLDIVPPETPIMDEAYEALLARGEMHQITPEDEERLRAKVARLHAR